MYPSTRPIDRSGFRTLSARCEDQPYRRPGSDRRYRGQEDRTNAEWQCRARDRPGFQHYAAMWKIRVCDAATRPLDIRGFYLFVCLEQLPQTSNQAILSALAVVDGNVLNDDFDLYLSITGERTKRIGLGTFSDGVDRARPMLIFANPLGVPELGHGASMIHADHALAASISDLALAFVLKRSVGKDSFHTYYCYRHRRDGNDPIRELVDPFPTPLRDTRTRPRGRFTLPFTL